LPYAKQLEITMQKQNQ